MAEETPEKQSLSQDNLAWYLKSIGNVDPLTAEEEQALARKIQQGDEKALQRLVEANLRFVVSIVKKYRGLGVNFLDLLNEGNLGLIAAAKRFDPDKNVKFISYAVWWVRQAIIHALNEQGSAIRLPQKQSHMAFQINRKAKELRHKLGREASHGEIAETMGLEEEEVRTLMQLTADSIPLEAFGEEDQDLSLVDKLEQQMVQPADEKLLQDVLEEHLNRLLEVLDRRPGKGTKRSRKEEIVIRLRFGLGLNRELLAHLAQPQKLPLIIMERGYIDPIPKEAIDRCKTVQDLMSLPGMDYLEEFKEPLTLQEVGDLLRISRERVRQIEKRALIKLRSNQGIQELRNFITS
jgi:RNA polymerase primary sigma factor